MYLSNIRIEGFRCLKDLTVEFSNTVNIIIGENGCGKSAVIDAIRILYNFGKQRKDIFVDNSDFYCDHNSGKAGDTIRLTYEFRDLTTEQKGALYEFMVVTDHGNNDYAKVVIAIQRRDGKSPLVEYSTGEVDGQKADFLAFEFFQHYYLDALRDSTRALLRSKKSILGDLVLRIVEANKRRSEFDEIIGKANSELLAHTDVKDAQKKVNDNLEYIYRQNPANQIGIRIESPGADSFIHSLKPFLPFDVTKGNAEGFELNQNSLGFNNLIYIAIILGGMKEQVDANPFSHFALLIEEPEAHLHPQLQLSLFNFLQQSIGPNTQVFISSHSPTLTSKVPLENLIVLEKKAVKLDSCFKDRTEENLIEDTVKKKLLNDSDMTMRRRQLERYLDVTRSQLLFAKGILFVEGISEELLIPAFCSIMGFKLEDYRIELVNVSGTSFYPFLHLFSSPTAAKKLDKRVSILTDQDQFTDSKKAAYSFDQLIADDYRQLDDLHSKILAGTGDSRIDNLNSAKNGQPMVQIHTAFKTFEYEIARANIGSKKSELDSNLLFRYLKKEDLKRHERILAYTESIGENFETADQDKIALLLWKSLTSKAEFAQDFGIYLLDNHRVAGATDFIIPSYIRNGLDHLKQ